jgi:hypothetical protein
MALARLQELHAHNTLPQRLLLSIAIVTQYCDQLCRSINTSLPATGTTATAEYASLSPPAAAAG